MVDRCSDGAAGETQQVAAAHLPAQDRVGLHVGQEWIQSGWTHGGGITTIKVGSQGSPAGERSPRHQRSRQALDETSAVLRRLIAAAAAVRRNDQPS
jgi:hypothetical protein